MSDSIAGLNGDVRPHFLFNTLKPISGYVDEDPAKAVEMIVRLSDLLRASLNDQARSRSSSSRS